MGFINKAAACVKRGAQKVGEVVGDLLEDGSVRIAAAGTGLMVVGGTALAQTADSAVTAIEAQSTRGVAIAGALLAMGVAIWAGMYIYRKFFR